MKGYFPYLHYEVVMINKEGVSLPIVLDPAQIYFTVPKKTFFERIFADPQLDFRNITRSINSLDVINQVAQIINQADSEDKRFLQLYKEYWRHATKQGNQKAAQLLEKIR